MAGPTPPELAQLLAARDATAQETAWAEFAQAHSRLLLHVARSIGRDYDAAMDAYAFVLERLREDDFRRLRCYTADGKTKFTTWLVVVVRRLCLDQYRERYGRARGADEEAVRQARRRLVDLLSEHMDLIRHTPVSGPPPDVILEQQEVSEALESALQHLAARDRMVLALRFEDGLSAGEIRHMMHFPTPFHVYRLINRALARLRAILKQRGLRGGADR